MKISISRRTYSVIIFFLAISESEPLPLVPKQLATIPSVTDTTLAPSMDVQTTSAIFDDTTDSPITPSLTVVWTTTVNAASVTDFKQWSTIMTTADTIDFKPRTTPQYPVNEHYWNENTNSSNSTTPLVYVVVVLVIIIFMVMPLAYIIYTRKKGRRTAYEQDMGFIDDIPTVMDNVDILENCGVSRNGKDTVVHEILIPLNALQEMLKTASLTRELTFKIPAVTVEKILCELAKINKDSSSEKSFLPVGNIINSRVNNLSDIRELLRLCFFEKGDPNGCENDKLASNKNETKQDEFKPDVIS